MINPASPRLQPSINRHRHCIGLSCSAGTGTTRPDAGMRSPPHFRPRIVQEVIDKEKRRKMVANSARNSSDNCQSGV